MSWLFKTLQSNDPDSSSSSSSSSEQNEQEGHTGSGGGVKDDLSVIGEKISRQFRSVANFLAPPPQQPPSSSSPPPSTAGEEKKSQALLGIRNDLAEIGGSLKGSLSLLSSNKAVSEISKFTSNFLQFKDNNNNNDNYNYDDEEEDDDDDDVAGITEEVIDFIKEISMRPECWTDFPLSLPNDFRMSDAQREHASTIERIVPSFITLRASLHSSMVDEQFWMIYFILLLPRLNEHDFGILSTPQIVKTRNILLQKLKNMRDVKMENSNSSSVVDTSQDGNKVSEIQEEDVPSREKEAAETVTLTKGLQIDDEENTEQWLEETDIDAGTSLDNQRKLEHEEDVSFSDLEDDDNNLSPRLLASTKAQGIRAPSPSGSSDWVQLNESSETQGGAHKARQSISRNKDSDGESSDWLKVDEFD